MRRGARFLGAALVWLLIALAALTVSLLVHLQLPISRRVARDALNDFVSGEMAGELAVGRIDVMEHDRVVARHVALYDPDGRRVVVADEVEIVPDLEAALEGKLRFESAVLRRGTVRLEEGADDLPTLIESFEPAEPSTEPDTGEPFHAIVDGMELHDVTLYGELLGLEGIRAEGVEAAGRLEVREEVHIDVTSGSGKLVSPFPFVGHIDALGAQIDTAPKVGTHLTARAHRERDDGLENDKARVELTYAVPEDAPPGAEEQLTLVIDGDPIHADTLHQLGYDWAEILQGRLDGTVRLEGPPDDLRLHADVESEGGPVTVTGELPSEGTVVIEGSTDSVDLGRLVKGAPTLNVGGSAKLEVAPAEDGESDPRATLDLEPFTYEGWAVPSLRVEGRLGEDEFTIDDVSAPYAGGRVSGSGHVHYDGMTRLKLRARIPQIARDPNIRRMMPDARGSLDADVTVAMAGEGREGIDFRGRVMLRDVKYGPLTAHWLELQGWARGDPDRPRVDLDVTGGGVALAEYPLGLAHVDLTGGPREYLAKARFEAPGERRIELDATVTAGRNEYVLNADTIELAVGDLVWRGALHGATLHGEDELTVDELRLANASQRLQASGSIRFDGPLAMQAQLQDFDLTALSVVFGERVPEVAGRVDAHVELGGTLDTPDVLLQGALRDAVGFGVTGLDVAYVVTYDGEGNIGLDAQADFGKGGSVVVVSSGIVDPELALEEALENGVYELELAISQLDFEVLRDVVGEGFPPVDGEIGGRLTASGPIVAPSFDGALEVPALGIPGWPEIGVRTEVSYESGVLNALVQTEDEAGALAESEVSLLIDLVNLVQNPAQGVASLETVPWRVSFRLPSRTVSEMPAPVQAALPASLDPLEVGLSATFQGGAFRTRGDVMATLGWSADLSGLPCGGWSSPRANVVAALRDDQTTVEVTTLIGKRQVMVATATAPTPLDQWLMQARVPEPPPTKITAEMSQMDLEGLPVLCEYAAGPVTGRLELTDLFTESPSAEADLRSEALSLRRFRHRGRMGSILEVETPPVEAALDARLSPTRLEAGARLAWWNDGHSRIDATTPVRWGGEHVVPVVEDAGDLDAELALDHTPIAPLLAWIPGVVDVEGTLTGRLALGGTVADPRVEGDVELERGYLEIVSLGQQLSDLRGKLSFHGNWLELESLTARDRDGTLTLRGGIELDGVTPTGLQLVLDAEEFPVRQEGSVLATLTGNALLDGNIEPDRAQTRLTVRQLTVTMPEDVARSVQDLEQHPDVVVVGQEQQEEERETPYPLIIRIVAEKPFYVQRRDLGARVTTDITAIWADPVLSISGHMQIRRGFFEVFGKRFEVERAGLNFQGGTDVNPEVSLVATHTLRGRPGDTVTVTVTGRLARPEVAFASTVQGCQERSQIIALLVSGRCGIQQTRAAAGQQQQAGQQAAGFLSGIAAGVLTLTAREEFGDVLPVIVIESGDEAFRSARVRLGFQADQFIPEFLRPVVTGAYVEGFFTAGGGADAEQGTTVGQGRDNGFLLELQFPHSIVGSGSFSPPDNWSVDLTWEP